MEGADLVAQVKAIAEQEFFEAKKRTLIEEEKMRLRRREKLWVRLFPWRLRLERVDDPLGNRDRFLKFLELDGYEVIRDRSKICTWILTLKTDARNYDPRYVMQNQSERRNWK